MLKIISNDDEIKASSELDTMLRRGGEECVAEGMKENSDGMDVGEVVSRQLNARASTPTAFTGMSSMGSACHVIAAVDSDDEIMADYTVADSLTHTIHAHNQDNVDSTCNSDERQPKRLKPSTPIIASHSKGVYVDDDRNKSKLKKRKKKQASARDNESSVVDSIFASIF